VAGYSILPGIHPGAIVVYEPENEDRYVCLRFSRAQLLGQAGDVHRYSIHDFLQDLFLIYERNNFGFSIAEKKAIAGVGGSAV
jgi:hypothetical protein